MAKQKTLLSSDAELLFQRGVPAFVDEIRQCSEADRLGNFAIRWYGDQRPEARALLLEYLDRMPNAFRHEALVKRLFKLAEKVGDFEVMAAFMVFFDRSVRKVPVSGVTRIRRSFSNKAEAQELRKLWTSLGSTGAHVRQYGDEFLVSSEWDRQRLRVPNGTRLPARDLIVYRNPRTGDSLTIALILPDRLTPDEFANLPKRVRLKSERLRLFSVRTRHYLRRRVWRCFRKLAQEKPERYVPAVCKALKRYRDSDVSDGIALLDNWGLMHVLFHDCPAIEAKANGWRIGLGRTLRELAPAPYREDLWKDAPLAVLDLLKTAKCRTVRRWAIGFMEREANAFLNRLTLEAIIELLNHEDEAVVALAARLMGSARGLDQLSVERWLELAQKINPSGLDVLCELMFKYVRTDQLTFAQILSLTASRPLPLAKLGLGMLRTRKPTTREETLGLLGLVEAESDQLRAEIVRHAREILSASPFFQPAWVLDYLDSRHGEVREEGWSWLQADQRARDSVDLWQKLLETPYDDLRFKVVADLEQRALPKGHALSEHIPLNPHLLQSLWATVLLNVHRGNRNKPMVIRQIVQRLEKLPADAENLLPLLSVALRSLRGPEFRAGLTAVVRIAEQNAIMRPVVLRHFPELKIG